jgi:hypothetical protein
MGTSRMVLLLGGVTVVISALSGVLSDAPVRFLSATHVALLP